MMGSSARKGFILLQPGPLAKDEFRGDIDLFEAHKLSKIAGAVLGRRFKVDDYLNGLPHAKEFRRGPGMELAPLAGLHPSTAPPDFAPLSEAVLASAFTLQPGPAPLADADLGVPVNSTALGSSALHVAAPAAAPAAPADSGATTATAVAAGARPTLKFKVTMGDGKKRKR